MNWREVFDELRNRLSDFCGHRAGIADAAKDRRRNRARADRDAVARMSYTHTHLVMSYTPRHFV